MPYVGGGFGSKERLIAEAISVALAMKVKGKPVKVVFSREEEFTSDTVKHPAIIRIKTGVKKDGTLLAREVELFWDTGAYGHYGPLVCRNGSYPSGSPYQIPHLKIDGYCVYTNKPIGGAFRGFGAPQAAWAYESQMDIIAEKLGLDPLEIRLRNGFEEGSISMTGQVLQSVGLKECLRRVAAALAWDKASTAEGYGKGIACIHRDTVSPAGSTAFIKVGEDGSVEILTSTVELGQGSDTVLAQIVAEELAVPLSVISVSKADTDYTPYDRSTTASRSTFHMGNAVRAAAKDAKRKLLEIASNMLEIPPEELELRDGRVFAKGNPEVSVSLSQAIASRWGKREGTVIGAGEYLTKEGTPLHPETGQGSNPSVFWMYAAQGAEVKVDHETGKVDVLRLVAAHDVGKAINPLLCEQQIEGSLVMGLGGALLEEMVLENGKTQNSSFLDYKIPTASDVPEMQAIIVEVPHRGGPFGAKGLGEPALAPTAAAIGNALYNAIGVRIRDLPITPEKLLKALREKASESKGREPGS